MAKYQCKKQYEEEVSSALDDFDMTLDNLVIIDDTKLWEQPDLVKETRAQNPKAAIMVFSPDYSFSEARDCMMDGADAYLQKSTDPVLIRNLVRDVLSVRRKLNGAST